MTALSPMRWWHLDEVLAIESVEFGPAAWTREQYYAELAAEDRWLQVARMGSGDAIVGYVDVSVIGRVADLMTIVVAAQHRGVGVGAVLLDAALAHARGAGAQQMLLEVRSDNPAANLYRSRGFEVLDVRRRYYADGADALIMRVTLAEDNGAHGRQ